MADWTTISSLATGFGTLVLATATFASVRSANRAARTAERSLLAGIRPLVVTTRFDDPQQKVGFMDDRWFHLRGSGAAADVTDNNVYLAMSLRNVGTGIAVLDRWDIYPERLFGDSSPRGIEHFRRLTRDIYIAPGDIGFWQGALREADAHRPEEVELHDLIAEAVKNRTAMTIDLLYGDYEGGQHTISRFAITPRGDTDEWMATGARHWNLDRDDPR